MRVKHRRAVRREVLALLWLLVAPVGAAWPADSPARARAVCARADKACAAKALQGHPVTRLSYWQRAMDKPVAQRIGIAPRELVEYVTLDNIVNDMRERPRAAKPDAEFLRDVRRAFGQLPAEVRRLLAPKLAGIYLVENLGGTGYTDVAYDGNAKAVAGYVVLNVSTLKTRTANAWATWKENTPFSARRGFQLAAEIEAPRSNNRWNAIQYILLHELGHVLSIDEKFHPPWTLDAKDVPPDADYPYFRLSWTIDRKQNRYVSIFDDAFREREDVVYYAGAKLGAERMVAVYDELERTNFATLYAVTRPGDDFAEAFASFVHTELMKRPFAIRIYVRGRLAKTYRSCWRETRCAEKRALLERFLGVPQ